MEIWYFIWNFLEGQNLWMQQNVDKMKDCTILKLFETHKNQLR